MIETERLTLRRFRASLAGRSLAGMPMCFSLHAKVPSEWGILWVHMLDR